MGGGGPGECERIGEKCSLVGFESSLRRRERERGRERCKV